MKSIEQLIAQSRNEFDLTSEESQQSLYTLAEQLMEINQPIDFSSGSLPLEFRMAGKLVKSRKAALDLAKPVKLGVIFAMWGEQNRLLPKSEANPNGEDTLRTKLAQLEWVCRDTRIDWTLYAVDDGCPKNSGKIAQKIVAKHPLGKKVRVYFLDEHVPATEGPLTRLASANDSRKGGAIILGALKAIEDGMEAIIYTDADNSVHLGQIGILLEKFDGGFKVVLGNRKDPDSILVKQENRWGIGIKLLRHMQRMVGHSIFSQDILDTQAAFKLYESQLLKEIIKDPAVFDFSFDSDWISAVLASNIPFAKVPFAFIDSFAESASIVQGPMTTWETLLMGLIKSVRHRNLPHNEDMAQVLIEEVESSETLDLLIHHLPPQLQSATDAELGNPEIMSPDEVREWIRGERIKSKE